MMVRTVMLITTSAVATMAAVVAATPSAAANHCDKGCENAFSPTMPFSTPMEVMPICTVDKNFVGLSCRSMAAAAPGSAASTITCNRALRLAVSAISDMAKRPLSRMRKTRSDVSMRAAQVVGGCGRKGRRA